ncbi:MAG: hypothetical protein R3C05_21665 [Pirellulaceae bacterium]
MPNHRLKYLDYEGEVSDNRGSVRRIDAGLFEVVQSQPHDIIFRLNGSQLSGLFQLSACEDDQCGWVIVRREDFARR